MKFGLALIAAISMLGAVASGAGAADRLFWANYNGDLTASISAANLDGSGAGSDLFTGAAPRGGTVNTPAGLALDPANGWAYWGNTSSTPPSAITRGSIDGCDAAATCAANLYPLISGGPAVNAPGGPALDAAHGLMYWMNIDGSLVRASLDGSGTVDETVNTTGATPLGGGGTGGLAIDPRTNRIYWTSDDFSGSNNKISWAALDGSGGGDVNTSGANVSRPWGLAIDTASNRVYWTSFGGAAGAKGSVSWASLDGTGGGDLYTSASPGCDMLNGPNGVAVDHAANKIYWANYQGNTLSSANLDGSGGCANVGVAGASLFGPDEVAVLKAPVADAKPTLSGTPKVGEVLTCGPVTWGGDSAEANLYRAARSAAYQWKKDGAVISGANATTFVPGSSGSYTCAAVANNAAGSTASESAAVAVKREVWFAKPTLRRKTRGAKLLVTGKVTPLLTAPGVNRPAVLPTFSAAECSGSIKLKFKLKKKTLANKSFSLKYKGKKCSAGVSVKLAKKYKGKTVKLTISIGRSTKLTAKPKTVSVKL